MKEERGSWYLLTGLVIGIILGVVYTLIFQPTEYVDTTPASLGNQYKDIYRGLIASAYIASNDLVRAEARLELLEDEDIYYVLAEQAQRMLADGSSPMEAQALGLLALALGQDSNYADDISEDQENSIIPSKDMMDGKTPESGGTESNPEGAIENSETSSENITSPPGYETSYELVSRRKVCDLVYEQPMIQIRVRNSQEQPVPGVEIIVSWETGEERYFTGQKPDMGLGYADFAHSPEGIYFLRVGNEGNPDLDFSAAECIDDGGNSFWGAWSFEFQQTQTN